MLKVSLFLQRLISQKNNMTRKTIEEQTEILQTYEIKPLKDRVSTLEQGTSKDKLQSIFSSLFSQKLKEEEFQNKVGTLFAKKLKEEDFINKIESITKKEINSNRQTTIVKIVSYVGGGFILALLGGLAQKFLGVF